MRNPRIDVVPAEPRASTLPERLLNINVKFAQIVELGGVCQRRDDRTAGRFVTTVTHHDLYPPPRPGNYAFAEWRARNVRAIRLRLFSRLAG